MSGDRAGIESVHVLLDLLELLARSEKGGGVTELASALGTSKARVYRYLRTLMSRGYVSQDSELDRYHLGIQLYLLGQSLADRLDLVRATRRPGLNLRDELGLTVTVMSPIDGKLVCVGLWRGRMPVEISLQIGANFPFHSTSGGKLALAYRPAAVPAGAIEGPHPRYTEKTITDPRELAAEVETCRRRGWATAADESLPGINALAAPIFNHAGGFVGTIAVVGSVQVLPANPDTKMIHAVVKAARDASWELGWSGPNP